MGSPPPTRGTPSSFTCALCKARITPAYAGNTHSSKNSERTLQDHPRLRGEHLNAINLRFINIGSPPPTRGTPVNTIFDWSLLGITPAYAGNTSFPTVCAPSCWDHPRLRGEHRLTAIDKPFCLGSPPPTRGTLHTLTQILLCKGITPAYAGNTELSSEGLPELRDHPRLRGEHLDILPPPLPSLGSPPPTRGTRLK